MQMNPSVRAFFNLTAGLEKFIIALLAAVQVWVGAIGVKAWGLDPATVIFIQAAIGAVQMLYTTNTTPTPPNARMRADMDRLDA